MDAGNRNIAPCRECEDRAVGCHAKCERYNSWREELNAGKDERICKAQATRNFLNFKNEQFWKQWKGFNRP